VGNQNSPRGLQLVDNAAAKTGKAVLVSIDKGFAEYDVVGGAQLNKISTLSNVTSAVRVPSDGTSTLPPGTTVLVRDANPTELDYLDAKGATALPAVKMTFASGGTEVRKLERNATTGHFSFTKYESASAAYIYEVTELGAMVAKIQLPPGAKGYNAVWIDAGRFMATTGSNANVVTLDAKTGAVSGTLGGKNMVKDAAGAVVFTDFFSGLFVLPNGNAVAANWLGHVNASSYANTPELLEFSPANKLVWSWGNQMLATYITYGYFIR
jgi:hypothetical protein